MERCAFCSMEVSTPHRLGGKVYCSEGCALRERELDRVRESLSYAHMALAESLSAALDVREKDTGLHSKRVACHTLLLARRFSSDGEWLRQVYWGALLHDVGKIGVPDHVLLKAGGLTEDEWATMRTHPALGRAILADVPFMAVATELVYSHQERFDGSGYPRRLRGEEIPLGARLFAVIDTLDAITSDRPYRKGAPFERARDVISSARGTEFDPVAVDAFSAAERELREMVRLKCARPYPAS